jgi:hypothetical protein
VISNAATAMPKTVHSTAPAAFIGANDSRRNLQCVCHADEARYRT